MYKIVKNKKHAELRIDYKGEVKTAIVDLCKLPEIKNFNWNIWKKSNKYSGKTYYYVACRLSGKVNRRTYYLHHLVAGKVKGDLVVDHINRDTLDNRSINLRITTRKENRLNSECFDK